jgi:glycosyltransferase involved in cell wall biosynthesis
MSLRILFAIHGPPDPATAVFKTVCMRAEYLRTRGHLVDVISPADFTSVKWPRIQPLLLPVALAARDLHGYDVVVFHSYLAWAHHARPRGRRKRPASVIAFHGLEPLYHEAVSAELARTGERLSGRFRALHSVVLPRLLKLACRRADRVVCLNSRESAFIVDQHWAEASKVVVLANGVPRDLLLEPRHYASHATRILFTGQWLRAKGIRYLVDAFSRIASTFSGAELTCVGTGAARDVVLRDFPAAQHDRVRVLPRVSSEELASELARADVFVFPSLSEGFSKALLEAMASGLPVIATPVGAAPDLIANGVNGLVVPCADAAALADAVTRVVPDAGLRESMGRAARQTASRYEWDAVNASFAAEIERVAGERQ